MNYDEEIIGSVESDGKFHFRKVSTGGSVIGFIIFLIVLIPFDWFFGLFQAAPLPSLYEYTHYETSQGEYATADIGTGNAFEMYVGNNSVAGMTFDLTSLDKGKEVTSLDLDFYYNIDTFSGRNDGTETTVVRVYVDGRNVYTSPVLTASYDETTTKVTGINLSGASQVKITATSDAAESVYLKFGCSLNY